jgi:hypothetical protein
MTAEKYNDYPLSEIVPACEELIKDGAVIYQKWTCRGCGRRLTANNPNTITAYCHCEECGKITDIQKYGCNYLVHFLVR